MCRYDVQNHVSNAQNHNGMYTYRSGNSIHNCIYGQSNDNDSNYNLKFSTQAALALSTILDFKTVNN